MSNWSVIVPLNHYMLDEELDKSINFDSSLSISTIPSWLIDHKDRRILSRYEREQVLGRSELAFIVEYTAESPGEPDPVWKSEPTPKALVASEKVNMACLALWIVKPSLIITYSLVLTFKKDDDSWFLSHGYSTRECKVAGEDLDNRLSLEEFDQAISIYKTIAVLPREGSLWVALCACLNALRAEPWDLRLLVLWIALEALFGTHAELTYRISLRLAVFLEERGEDAWELCQKVKKMYGSRNTIVHGRGLPGKEAEERSELVHETELLVRRSLQKIITDEKLRSVFSSKDRDNFLDRMVLGSESGKQR